MTVSRHCVIFEKKNDHTLTYVFEYNSIYLLKIDYTQFLYDFRKKNYLNFIQYIGLYCICPVACPLNDRQLGPFNRATC